MEDREEAQVLSFAPEDTWAVTGREWRQTDILWLPWLEGKQEHALEISNSTSQFLAERNRKKIACRYTTIITVFFSPSENKTEAETVISETNSKDKYHLTWKILLVVFDYSFIL